MPDQPAILVAFELLEQLAEIGRPYPGDRSPLGYFVRVLLSIEVCSLTIWLNCSENQLCNLNVVTQFDAVAGRTKGRLCSGDGALCDVLRNKAKGWRSSEQDN